MTSSPKRDPQPHAAFSLLEEAELLAHDLLVAVHQSSLARPQLVADGLDAIFEVEQIVLRGVSDDDLSTLRQRLRRLKELRRRARTSENGRHPEALPSSH